MDMKLFISTFFVGSSSFSPIPIGRADFDVIRGGLPEDGCGLHPRLLPQITFRHHARAAGWEVAESLCATAQPGGTVNCAAYEALRDEILDDLRAAMPVDAVCLALYGGTVAFGYPDCDADILTRVRETVGPAVPVGVAPNHHCNLTRALVELATAVVTYKEYPHTDHAARAAELFEIIAAAAEGRTRPHMSVFDCRMIGHYHTNREPMRGFVDRVKALEGRDSVLSISPIHGFIHSDTPEMGTKMLVITDDEPDEGAALAAQLGRELFALRDKILPSYLSIEDAVSRVAAAEAGPILLAECLDNPHGLTAGDSTRLLEALMDAGLSGIAISPIYDPGAVALAMAAGEGAEIDLRIGGKVGAASGPPLDLRVEVMALRKDFRQPHVSGGVEVGLPLGACAAVRGPGVDIVLASLRQQTFALECFTGLGIEPASRRALVVKSMIEFKRAFEPVASEILYVDTDIPESGDQGRVLRTWPYQFIDRPKWPLDDITEP